MPFDQDAIDNEAFVAQGKLTMPVLAVGGEVITDSKDPPVSFATLGYFGNNAFIFVDSAGIHYLKSTAATKLSPNYLFDDLHRRIARGPIRYRLFVQLANPGDPTNDGSMVWPNDRKRVQLGSLSLTAIAPDNDALQRSLRFNPIFITDGIQLSDDPFVPLRSVYALSVQHRQKREGAHQPAL